MNSTIVLTGATRGIGRVAAERIVRESPDTHLVVVARGASGARLAAELGGTVSHVEADLASLASVRAAATGIRARLDSGELPPLHCFAGNAGMQYTNALTETPDGYEASFAINVLANHLFVRLLEDSFATPARVVITTSDTHIGDFRHNLGLIPAPVWQAPEILARPGAFAKPKSAAAGRTAYSTGKLATIYLVHEYTRRLPAGVDAVAFNPGFVPGTGLARNASPVERLTARFLLPLLAYTPLGSKAADAGRWLADVVLGKLEAPTGSYVDRDRVARSSAESYDTAREAELWDAAEKLTRSA